MQVEKQAVSGNNVLGAVITILPAASGSVALFAQQYF